MTAVAEDLDLDRWVTFGGDDADQCDGVVADCPMEAVVRALFSRACKHGPDSQLFCAPCRDLFRWMGIEPMACLHCGSLVTFLRFEPVR